jgi:hypothetical protein
MAGLEEVAPSGRAFEFLVPDIEVEQRVVDLHDGEFPAAEGDGGQTIGQIHEGPLFKAVQEFG